MHSEIIILMACWYKEDKGIIRLKTILFVISPFISFIYGLFSLKTKTTYIVMFFFFLVFGLSFTVGTDRLEQGLDGVAYRVMFEESKKQTTESFLSDFHDFITFQALQSDFYAETMVFVVSRFTYNYHYLFFSFALVLGSFTLLCLRYLTKSDYFKQTILCFILFFLFTKIQIFSINGCRFYTAFWIAAYCIFRIIIDRAKSPHLLLFITPFIHGAFWFLIIVLYFILLTKRFEKSWFVIYCVGFVLSSYVVDLMNASESVMPSFIPVRFLNYLSDYKQAQIADDESMRTTLGAIIMFINKAYFFMIPILMKFKSTEIKTNEKAKSVYLFLIPYCAICNIFTIVPLLGARFLSLAYPFYAYIWVEGMKCKYYKWFIYLMPIVMVRDIYYMLYNYTRVLEFDFFYQNIFYLLYKYA